MKAPVCSLAARHIETPVIARDDPQLLQARAAVIKHQKASVSLVQRCLNVTWSRANALLGQLQRDGVVSMNMANSDYFVQACDQVAQPARLNLFTRSAYVPEPAQSVRPGADDHRKVQSRGYRT